MMNSPQQYGQASFVGEAFKQQYNQIQEKEEEENNEESGLDASYFTNLDESFYIPVETEINGL